MNLYEMRPGDRVRTRDGNVAEVTAPTQDGEWIQVRYVDATDPTLNGTLDLTRADELELADVTAKPGA